MRPAVKPPPVPAYAAEQRPQIKPVASPQRQYSPQAYTPPPSKSAQLTEQKRNRAPPLPSGPPPLPSHVTKTHSQHSAVPKQRPDPPNRSPPPCPINKPPAVSHFCMILSKATGRFCFNELIVKCPTCHSMYEQLRTKGLQVTTNALQRGKAALAPSAGQK